MRSLKWFPYNYDIIVDGTLSVLFGCLLSVVCLSFACNNCYDVKPGWNLNDEAVIMN